MAGYLGKISAIVSANTGDFKSKLGGAAKDVQNFARQVQSNLTSASKDAAKAFKDIYTPLQQFERSLQAASTMKLSFKGFAGAIKDIDALKVRLTGLRDSQIGLVVKASGFQTITAFREAIRDIKSKDIDVIAKVGGLDKLMELRNLSKDSRQEFVLKANASALLTPLREAKTRVADLRASLTMADARGGVTTAMRGEFREALQTLRQLQQEARKEVRANVGVNLDDDALDELIAKASKISNTQIKAVINVLGQQDLEAAVTKAQQLQSVARQIATPFGAAAEKMAGLSVEVQAGFLPALKRSQAQIESLKDNIEKAVLPASAISQQFTVVEKRALAAVAAVDRLAEASSKVGSMKTGQELAFAAPQLSATLDRGVDIGNKAAALPASAIQANPRVASMLQEISTLSNEAVAAYARLQVKMGAGLPTASQQKQFDAILVALNAVESETEQATAAANQYAASRRIASEQAEREAVQIGVSLASLREAGAVAGQYAAARRVVADEAAREAVEIGVSLATLQSAGATAGQYAAARRVVADEAAREAVEIGVSLASLQSAGAVAGQYAAARRVVADEAAREAVEIGVSLASLQSAGAVAGQYAAARRVVADEAAREAVEIGVSLASLQSAGAVAGQYAAARRVAAEQAEREAVEIGVSLDALRQSAVSLPGNRIGNPTGTFGPTLPPGFGGQASGGLSASLDDPLRQLGRFGQSLESIKGQLDALPGPMRSHFIPAIAAAEQEFIRLRALGPAATAQEIENATDRMRTLEASAKRATTAFSFESGLGGRGAQDLELNIQSQSLSGYRSQLQILQQTLGTVSSEARGPAVAAFMRLQQAISQAFQEGRLDSAATRQEIARLTREAVTATAQVAGVGAGDLSRRVARAGDVGRGGADKFSLFLNQAAFAVDDFMSSTGGLEFKLRAISNNITQMGFVLGGTTGLFVGLGAVLGGQVALGIMKFINNGRTAEDQTKALNDALARQKSLVEELAQAFRSLGDSMSQGTFSEAGERRQQVATQVEDIRKKQKEARTARVADLDAGVQRERSEQNKFGKMLESETDVGRRIAIQREILESKRREREARDAAASRVPAAEEARDRVRTAMERIGIAELGPNRGDDASRGAREEQVRQRAAAATAGIPVGNTVEDVRGQIAAVNAQIDSLRETAAGSSPLGYATAEVARKEILALEKLLRSLEMPLRTAIDELAVSIVDASRGPAEQIRQAQAEVAKAIELGLPGARAFGLELDNNAKALKEAYKKLEKAAEESDTGKKEKLVKEAEGEIKTLEAKRAEMQRKADEFRLERTVDPQRQADARLSRASANLSAGGLEDGQIARRMREIEFRRESIRQQSAMPENQTAVMQGFFEGQQAALNNEVAALEAATIAVKLFGEALNRASEEVKSNLQAAENGNDQARRRDLGFSTARSREEREAAANDVERQREEATAAQRQIADERARLEEQVINGGGTFSSQFKRIREIDEQLQSGGLNSSQQAELRAERARLEAEVKPERDRIDSQARAAADPSTREEEQRQSAARGRELRMTPAQRAAEDVARGLEDIRQAFGREAESTTGIVDTKAQQQAQRRFLDDQMRAAAPAIAGLADSVANAVIQGPSRASLQATDASGVEGMRELDRLLRGDDSARDQNFVELQKQSELLQGIKTAVEESGAAGILNM
jgi:hypothetical protein